MTGGIESAVNHAKTAATAGNRWTQARVARLIGSLAYSGRDRAVCQVVHQVIYSSAAVVPFSEPELTQLLAAARINNGRLGVTGMLLYHEGSFLQALEGEEHVLENLYAKIGKDKRHHRLVALLRRQVDARHFEQWQMGFTSMNALPKNMPSFSDYLRLRGDPIESANAAARLLGAFRDGRFRSYVQV